MQPDNFYILRGIFDILLTLAVTKVIINTKEKVNTMQKNTAVMKLYEAAL